MSFDPRILSLAPFTPHPFAQIAEEKVYPAGAVPEAVYAQLVRKYDALEGVDVFRITYDSNGTKVTGIAAFPAGAAQSAHPLVIYNRGGMNEYGKLTVLNVINLLAPLAKAGYLVFASNYRGNDGSDGKDEFGGADVEDVISLLDIARSHPAWDEKNAFMAGHSRGGMMTYGALKKGAEVNAAVAISGIADLTTWLDKGNWLEKMLDREGFESRSATHWPQEIGAPLLLLHGDADEAVSHTQTLALAEKLSAAGMPHELHIYPGGNHALVRQWSDVTERILQWFTRYSD